VSLPTGYGKSLVYHLCGEVLSKLCGQTPAVTIVVTPLNVIQQQQVGLLIAHGKRSCRLGIGDRASLAEDENLINFETDQCCIAFASHFVKEK
jgi:superfamily II DNA helicase RecQ